MEITKDLRVRIVGVGKVGMSIVQTFAQAGFKVHGMDIDQGNIDRGLKNVEQNLESLVSKGKIKADRKDAVLSKMELSTDLDRMQDADVVIEAVFENMDLKKETFEQIDKLVVSKNALLLTNTSSLSVSEIASATKRPEMVAGMHFFNPVPIMKLCEVVKTLDTSEQAFDEGFAFAEKVGKKCVKAKDSPGFIVNVLLVPYLLDAIRQLESELATRDDIDNGMMLGCGHPMGPLTLSDFIGLDTILYIADIMFEEFKDSHYSAPPLLRRMVNDGHLGRKVKQGFYDYRK